MQIERNMGCLDRILRAGIGMACVYFGFIDATFINHTFVAGIVGVFGIINLASAATAFCPFYKLAGISTHASGGSA